MTKTNMLNSMLNFLSIFVEQKVGFWRKTNFVINF